MDYSTASDEPRTNAEQSETGDDIRVSYESPPKLKPGPRPGNWHRLFDGFVYFISAEETGCVKIGYTCEPKKRLSKLQTSSPHELRMIGYVEGSFLDEQRWHERFAHLRKRGEWFTIAPDLEAAIGEALSVHGQRFKTNLGPCLYGGPHGKRGCLR